MMPFSLRPFSKAWIQVEAHLIFHTKEVENQSSLSNSGTNVYLKYLNVTNFSLRSTFQSNSVRSRRCSKEEFRNCRCSQRLKKMSSEQIQAWGIKLLMMITNSTLWYRKNSCRNSCKSKRSPRTLICLHNSLKMLTSQLGQVKSSDMICISISQLVRTIRIWVRKRKLKAMKLITKQQR